MFDHGHFFCGCRLLTRLSSLSIALCPCFDGSSTRRPLKERAYPSRDQMRFSSTAPSRPGSSVAERSIETWVGPPVVPYMTIYIHIAGIWDLHGLATPSQGKCKRSESHAGFWMPRPRSSLTSALALCRTSRRTAEFFSLLRAFVRHPGAVDLSAWDSVVVPLLVGRVGPRRTR
jgi:hypothetical protein